MSGRKTKSSFYHTSQLLNIFSKVVETLNYLIKEKVVFTNKNFQELYFLPDNSKLKEIKQFISKTLKVHHSQNSDHLLKQVCTFLISVTSM